HANVAKCLSFGVAQLNVDEVGEPDWHDGALIARYLFGLRGRNLMEGIGRLEDAPEVQKKIKDLCPDCKE
ncbi:MAG: hypothetical protein MPL62_15460, partial [Alphaproteobacteria bacterium]|nr:hypothetical protein [Alphaproteobacteria bacterium]